MLTTLITAILAATLFFGGAGLTVQASQDALPGDTLYGLKTAMEEVQLRLSQEQNEQVRLQLQFAERRLMEILSLAEEERYEEISVAAAALESRLEQALFIFNTLADESPEDADDLLDEVEEGLLVHIQVLTALLETVPEPARPAIAHALMVSDTGRQVVEQIRLRDRDREEDEDQEQNREQDRDREQERDRDQQGDMPADRPIGPPSDRPIGPPEDRPIDAEDEDVAGPPADRPVGPPSDRPVGPPSDRPVDQDEPPEPPAERPVGPPNDHPVGPPAEVPAGPPEGVPTSPQSETPLTPPAEVPAGPQAEAPAEPPPAPPSEPEPEPPSEEPPSAPAGSSANDKPGKPETPSGKP